MFTNRHIEPTSFLHLLVLSLIILSTSACSSGGGGGSSAPGTDGDDTNQVTDSVTLSGVVAYGQAAAFADVCTSDGTTEYCITANAQGEYNLMNNPVTSGLVRGEFIAPDGLQTTYYSLFSSETGATTSSSNINEVTDLITRAYLNSEYSTTPETCFVTATCLSALQTGYDHSAVAPAINNLSAALGSLWPVDTSGNPINPFTEEYDANPSENPINTDGMIELLDFSIDTNTGLISVTDVNGVEVASFSMAELATSDQDNFLGSLTTNTIDALEAEAVLATLVLDTLQPATPIISVNVTVTETPVINQFQSPSNVSIAISASHQESLEITGWTAQLISPNGVIQTWTREALELAGLTNQTFTLTAVGTWFVVVQATDINGLIGQGGREIIIRRGDDTAVPATYGAAGSCQPVVSLFDQNSLNICIETMDGGALSIPPGECDGRENLLLGETQDDLEWLEARCRNSWQMINEDTNETGTFIGTCTQDITETRIFHYQNPLRPNNETINEAQNRLSTACTNQGGIWEL